MKELFDFIGLPVSEEEIRAMNELAAYKKEEHMKKNLDNVKSKKDFVEESYTNEDILRIFLVDDKLAEKE